MTKTSYTILLVEEDDATRAFLKDNLSYDGYRISAAEDRAKAIAVLSVEQPQLIIVDVNGQTLDLLDDVRSGERLAADPDTPIIVLSHRPDDIHRIRVLDRRGDDIIAKPFSYAELRARIAAVLRRAECRRHRRQLRFGPLTIDLAARQVRLGEEPIELAAKEYELLVALASDPHRVFTRAELLRDVWGYRTPSRTVDSHACRLRQRLSAHPQRLVINVWGVGYRFCDAQTHPAENRPGGVMSGVPRRSTTAPQPTCRQLRAAAVRTSMSPKDHPQSRPVPEQRGTMNRPSAQNDTPHKQHVGCGHRQRPSSRTRSRSR